LQQVNQSQSLVAQDGWYYNMASIISAGTTSGTALNMTGDTSGSLQLATNSGTTAVTIDTSQNVGIGTSSPGGKVQANAGSAQVALMAGGTVNNPQYPAFGFDGQVFSNGGRGAGMYLPADSTLAWATGATERMRIDASGNVLIGSTTSPTAAAGSFLCPNQLYLGGRTATVSGSNSVINMNYNGAYIYGIMLQNTTTTTGNALTFVNSSLTTIGSISTTSSATAYNTSSDYRLKENVAPMTGALDKVAQLKPVTYTWKADNSAGQGFIAHELQAVVPDCVTGEKDAVDADGKPIYQGVDTSFLVATLTAAIQEQQTIINDLKARITALEGAK